MTPRVKIIQRIHLKLLAKKISARVEAQILSGEIRIKTTGALDFSAFHDKFCKWCGKVYQYSKVAKQFCCKKCSDSAEAAGRNNEPDICEFGKIFNNLHRHFVKLPDAFTSEQAAQRIGMQLKYTKNLLTKMAKRNWVGYSKPENLWRKVAK